MILRTWTVRVARGGVLTSRQRFDFERTMRSISTRAHTEAEAARDVLTMLGVRLEPCCWDEPCADCRAELAAEAHDRGVDAYRDRALERKP